MLQRDIFGGLVIGEEPRMFEMQCEPMFQPSALAGDGAD